MPLGSGWYYNSLSGAIVSQPPVLGFVQGQLPDWFGPFPTKQAAEQYAQSHGGAQPGGFASNVGNLASGATSAAASSISSSILGPLFQKNIWLRVGEVVVGVILLAIGLNAMLKGKPLTVVTNTVGGAAKTAALA